MSCPFLHFASVYKLLKSYISPPATYFPILMYVLEFISPKPFFREMQNQQVGKT